ncbi:MAG TPA: patatin-like phospholipase family protein [Anaerolineaceae bacterium]|nr:patatin-like phospholipase family protein [Anaerolineaceae bacterium]
MAEIALALGGGGIKGIAHIGVIKVLEREGLKISAAAGTSVGGIIGSLLCAGYRSPDMLKAVERLKSPHFFSRTSFDGPSLMGVQGGVRVLEDYLGDRQFEDLPIPFACTAVDLNTSQEIILAHGRVVDAVLATIAVPGIFPSRQVDNFVLVDGGVLDPVPVSLARWLAPTSPVIAVCLTPAPEAWATLPDPRVPPVAPIPRPILEQVARLRIGQAFQTFIKSIDTTSRMVAELRMQIEKPEVIIRPDVVKYGILDNPNHFDTNEIVALGEAAAAAALPQIRQALSWSNQLSRFFKHTTAPGKILGVDDNRSQQPL